MTITRAEFDHKGVRYAAVFEPMTEEDQAGGTGRGGNRKRSGTRYHLAVREIAADGQELALLIGEYIAGAGCKRVSAFPGLTLSVPPLLRKASLAFPGARPTSKYDKKECCGGTAGRRCDLCERVRKLLDEAAEQRMRMKESGHWRELERRGRRLHCHHKGRRKATG